MYDFAVIVSVSDKHLWALKPFAFLFNKYWSAEQRVYIAGYSPPNFVLPPNFTFYSISQPQYPKEHWANGIYEFLDIFNMRYGVLLLEDYWLCRRVDIQAIGSLTEFMSLHPELLRVDLTGDRLYAGGMHDIDYWQRFDIIEAPESQYQMSLQAGLWNLELLKMLLGKLPENRRSAWDVELEGTNLIKTYGTSMRVVGTRQWPVRYANGLNNAAGKKVHYDNLLPDDIEVISQFVPEENR